MDYIFSRDACIKHTSIRHLKTSAFPVLTSKAFILKTPHSETEDQQSVSTAHTTQGRQKPAKKEQLQESLGGIKQCSPVPLISMIANGSGNTAGIPLILNCKTQGGGKKKKIRNLEEVMAALCSSDMH